MLVKDLISQLSTVSPSAQVWIQTDDDGIQFRELSLVDTDGLSYEELDALGVEGPAVILW